MDNLSKSEHLSPEIHVLWEPLHQRRLFHLKITECGSWNFIFKVVSSPSAQIPYSECLQISRYYPIWAQVLVSKTIKSLTFNHLMHLDMVCVLVVPVTVTEQCAGSFLVRVTASFPWRLISLKWSKEKDSCRGEKQYN